MLNEIEAMCESEVVSPQKLLVSTCSHKNRNSYVPQRRGKYIHKYICTFLWGPYGRCTMIVAFRFLKTWGLFDFHKMFFSTIHTTNISNSIRSLRLNKLWRTTPFLYFILTHPGTVIIDSSREKTHCMIAAEHVIAKSVFGLFHK